MDKMKQNYYGSLCTELYELLHKEAYLKNILRAEIIECGSEIKG